MESKGKELRSGYTTGTCSTAAAIAATMKAFGTKVDNVIVKTPKGVSANLQIIHKENIENMSICSVIKDSGDDPDITNGVEIIAKVELDDTLNSEVILKAGKGVGIVTLPGLACEVGQPAINPVPRKMIKESVLEKLDEFDYEGGAIVTISIPEGVNLARKTYNPKLGVEGGLSILGTSGIVEPMSEKALIDTIKVEMDVRKALGAEYIIVTPGNYGQNFLLNTFFKNYDEITDEIFSVKCSNYIGEALDYAEKIGIKGILFVGHIGKLVKVAGGIMNTHSSYADGRMEILSAHSALKGASSELIEKIMNSVTTDKAYEEIIHYQDKIKDVEFWNKISKGIIEKIYYHMNFRTHSSMLIELVMFSNKYGLLGKTKTLEENIHLFIK